MKMKKTLYTLLFASLPILATAQEAAAPLSLSVTDETAPESTPTLRFAWFSQEEVLRSMPEYQAAGRYVDSLKTEYAREAKRSADDFSLKYEEFLDQQRSLYPPQAPGRTSGADEPEYCLQGRRRATAGT